MQKLQESATYNPEQFKTLKKLITKGEGQQLEFKRKASHPEKIVREMVAFANSYGGILLVGIGDDKTIPGLKHPEDESYVIHQALKKCSPPLPLKETLIAIDNSRMVIQYEVEEGKRKPYAIIGDENVREAFVRVNDQSIKASYEMREIIRRTQYQKNIHFPYGECENLLLKYLDEQKTITLKKFREISHLNRFKASKKLVLLVLANVLRISPHEKGDVYSLAFHTSEKTSLK